MKGGRKEVRKKFVCPPLLFLPGAKDRVSAPKNFAFANNVPHRVISATASDERRGFRIDG